MQTIQPDTRKARPVTPGHPPRPGDQQAPYRFTDWAVI